MKRAWKIFFLGGAAVSLTLITGCATGKVPEPILRSESTALAEKFRALSPSIDPAEAARAADVAIRYPLELAAEYHAISPAWFNNVLINSGVHPRGLCYQWADDLTSKLMTLHLRTLEWHRGVAHLDTRREHSSVVVTAPGQPFNDGIALDAWRTVGKLHWSPVATDKYPWQEIKLPPDYQTSLQMAAEKLESASK